MKKNWVVGVGGVAPFYLPLEDREILLPLNELCVYMEFPSVFRVRHLVTHI
jgi:hypothetical protein